ncbi:MAG: hypothetical protein HOQ20_22620 [Bradyrhizobium sp.]|nr:hypothetical protein [Bradyrhizobium sp.]
MRFVLACLSVALVAASSPADIPRSPEAQAKLDKWLGGRVATDTKSCIPTNGTASPIGIDDRTVLFRDGPRIWRNDLRSGTNCGQLDKQSQVVTASQANRMCNGDDLGVYQNGTMVAACTLGDFVLYKRP